MFILKIKLTDTEVMKYNKPNLITITHLSHEFHAKAYCVSLSTLLGWQVPLKPDNYTESHQQIFEQQNLLKLMIACTETLPLNLPPIKS